MELAYQQMEHIMIKKITELVKYDIFDQIICRFIYWSCFTKVGIMMFWGLIILMLFSSYGSHHGADIG